MGFRVSQTTFSDLFLRPLSPKLWVERGNNPVPPLQIVVLVVPPVLLVVPPLLLLVVLVVPPVLLVVPLPTNAQTKPLSICGYEQGERPD
jgi:hypothetical protein